MPEFVRARSEEQKAHRLEEIKTATERLFTNRPYHKITLAVVAEELGWSRASLYNYASTKEEIFLSIIADKRDAYINALLTALPEGCEFEAETIAEVWAGIANAHRDFFRYGDILYTVVETNVSMEKLVEFKRGYYEGVDRMKAQLPCVLGVRQDRIEAFVNSVYHQGVGLRCSCLENPLVKKAVAQLGIEPYRVDFRTEMRDFIAMSLTWHRRSDKAGESNPSLKTI